MFEQFKIFKPKAGELQKNFESSKAPDIVPSLQTLFKKFPFSKEEMEQNEWLEGLEFNPEGYLASIRKNSSAEKIFAKIIERGGDAEFTLVAKDLGDFYVFEKKQSSGETPETQPREMSVGGQEGFGQSTKCTVDLP